MSDNTPKEEVQGIPQELADDIAALAADVSAMASRASRAWKTTAVVWIILLAVIATYLYLLVYKPLKEGLTPQNIVSMGWTTLNGALQDAGAPSLDSPSQVADWASAKIEESAPGLMQNTVKPRIESLLAQIPELREEWTERFRKEGPDWINHAVENFGDNVLPAGNEHLLNIVDEQVDELLAQFGDQVDAVIAQVIDQTGALLDDANLRGDQTALRGRIEAAFEDAMGPVLDEVLANLDEKVRSTGVAIGDLVDRYTEGHMSHKDKLEVRLIQLVLALFEGALEEAPTETDLIQQLRGVLKDAGMPVLEQDDLIKRVREAPQAREQVLQDLPPEVREKVRSMMAEDAARAAAARGQEDAPPPEIRKRMEEEEAAREAAAKAAAGAAQ
jgi:hypothetical protein